MKQEKFPARLHVLITQHSKQAIVIRRGPSKLTCVLAWDREKNTFTVSQWIKGRIYERRSDISPSGKYWIYFAMNGKWDSEAKGSWTAISRAPWLKAISLYAKGDCWHGGGLFVSKNEFWLNEYYPHRQLINSSEVKRSYSYKPPNQYGGECIHVYYNRLQRDGWVLKTRTKRGKWHSETVFEKVLPNKWILRKICHEQVGAPKGKGCYWDEHELENDHQEPLIMSNWGWAEWLDDSIVYAESGYLCKMLVTKSGKLSASQLLHDFNEYEFEDK